MKKILLLTLLLLLNISPILAQEEEGIVSSNAYFDLRLTRGVQSPINKSIPFTVYITPKIDSPRTQILWDVPTVFNLKTKHTEFVNLEKGKTYKYSASLTPDRDGAFNIAVNVISWQHDTNKTNTVKETITIGKGLTIQPPDARYTTGLIIFVLAVILGIVGFLFALVKIIQHFITDIKKWLTPPY